MMDPHLTLSLTTAGLVVLSCILLLRGGGLVTIGGLVGLLTAAATFLLAGWLLPGAPGHALLWHLALVGAALVPMVTLWRAGGLRRGYGTGFGAAMLGLVASSWLAFPAWIAGQVEAAAGGDPVCVVDRSNRPVGRGDLTFLGLAKSLHQGEGGLRLDLPLTAFVRTGEPQPRKDTPRNFALPPGLYDVAVFNWSKSEGAFRERIASSVLRRIPCIPSPDGLDGAPADDVMEMATAWGDFRVPQEYRPRDSSDAFSFRVPLHILLDEPPPAEGEKVDMLIGRLKFGEEIDERNRTPSLSREEAVKAGYVPDVDGFLRLESEGRTDRLRHASDGRPVTDLVCWKAPEADTDCEHEFVAEETASGFSTTIFTSYPPAYANRWEEIEAALRPLVATFSVPGPLPSEFMRPRPRPDCPGAVCEGMDALP